ncbi:MAG: DUF4034 domain-containing protein [Acidobacteriia bacterium]|nr:DUF4034 domain-containing protein [Terriglobia bacterium]
MSRRTVYASALLALSLATFAAALPAQESLGDAARRIRSKKGDVPTSPANRMAATPQPASPAGVNADLNAAITVSTERDEAAYSTRVRTQLEQENFKVLDDVAAAERAGRTRFPGGGWKLHTFYAAVEWPKGRAPVTEADWADTLDRLKRWVAQQPDSITAAVALARAYLNYAWQARGDGNAASVTAEGKRLFDERIKLAETELNQSFQLPAKCPEWYYVMLQVGRVKGWEVEDLAALFQRAIAYDPEYFYYYQEFALSLTPKWRGKEGDAEKFAEEQASHVGGKSGDMLYWLIAQSILGNRDLGNAPPQFSWSRALLGYQVLTERFGASPLRQNQLAQMAARFGDYMVTDETLTLIGDKWDQGTWGTREYFEKVRAWARDSAVPFRKIIEAYKAVNANIATPEGQKYDAVIAREFSARYAHAVKECATGGGPAPTLLVLQMDKSGSVHQVMVVPENANDACVRPKLEKAAFSPPPKPEYWVRVALSAKP